jgi:hypothetical protein
MALNTVAEWGMSLVVQGLENNGQDIDSCRNLIDSFSVTHLQKKSSNINVTIVDALQEQWTDILQQPSPVLNP